MHPSHEEETHISYSITITGDPTIIGEAPVIPQDGLEQERGSTRWETIDGIIRTHDTCNLCIPDAGLERREVVLAEILLRDNSVEPVTDITLPVFHIIGSKVLAIGNDLEVRLRVKPALQAYNQVVHVVRKMERIFSWCLLTSAPSRVFVRVDIRSPEIESGSTNIVEGTSFGTDDFSDLSDEFVVEGGTQDIGLRERSGRAEVAVCSETHSWTTRNAMLQYTE